MFIQSNGWHTDTYNRRPVGQQPAPAGSWVWLTPRGQRAGDSQERLLLRESRLPIFYSLSTKSTCAESCPRQPLPLRNRLFVVQQVLMSELWRSHEKHASLRQPEQPPEHLLQRLNKKLSDKSKVEVKLPENHSIRKISDTGV